MPKFFCDYCDVYLTHDSMSVRKAHNAGRNHLRNVVDYYQQIGHEKAQSVIDSITSSYAAEGQANPMLQMAGAGGMPFPPPGGFPGKFMDLMLPYILTLYRNTSTSIWNAGYATARRSRHAVPTLPTEWTAAKSTKRPAFPSARWFSFELSTSTSRSEWTATYARSCKRSSWWTKSEPWTGISTTSWFRSTTGYR